MASIEGAPHLREEDLPVFDCAVSAPGAVASHPPPGPRQNDGRRAAVPFRRDIQDRQYAPREHRRRDHADLHRGLETRSQGYRHLPGRKQTHPTSQHHVRGKSRTDRRCTNAPVQHKMPVERQALTHKFKIAGHEGYITVGMYEDGSPGEIFINMSKEGSTVSGLMDAFARAISYALQYGVPLEVLVDKFTHTRFEPSGFTGNPEIPYAKSITDYIFRWLASKFLSPEKSAQVGVMQRAPTISNQHTPIRGAVPGPGRFVRRHERVIDRCSKMHPPAPFAAPSW